MKYSIMLVKTQKVFISMAILLATRFPVHSQGNILAQHFGAQNPQSEGFNLVSNGHPSLGPVTNDMGMNAWSVSMTSSDGAQYFKYFTAQQTALLAGSWNLSLDLRILSAPVTPTYDVSAWIITGPQQFTIEFGMEADGDPEVQVRGSSLSPVFVVNGAGSTYNDYRLVYDASAGTASLWVNGSKELNGIVPGALDATLGSLSWSDDQPANGVGANWNLVSLTVPEPSTVGVFLLGGGALFYLRRKCRR